MSVAIRCDACGMYMPPSSAYRLTICTYLKADVVFEADLCAACKKRVIDVSSYEEVEVNA